MESKGKKTSGQNSGIKDANCSMPGEVGSPLILKHITKDAWKSFPCQFINKQTVLIPHVPK